MLKGRDVQELQPLGMSIQAISKLTGWDRKMIRKYLLRPSVVPEYALRQAHASKLDPFKLYLEERLHAGVWNAPVLLRKLRERNHTGAHTILIHYLAFGGAADNKSGRFRRVFSSAFSWRQRRICS